MIRRVPAAVLSCHLAALAACSGGGGGSPASTPPPPTVSGTISARAGQAVDVDTKDPNTSSGDNDSLASAQVVPGIVTVGGWASVATDRLDYLRAKLAPGQTITLLPADGGENDLDLCVAPVGDPAGEVCSTAGAGLPDQITIGATGLEVHIEVSAFSGASSYVLVLGQAAAATPTAVGLDRPFVPGEILIRFRDEVTGAQAAAGGPKDLPAKAASLGLVPLRGALRGRAALVGLPAAAADRARTLAALGAKRGRRDAPGLDASASPAAEARQETLDAIAALRRRPDVASADPNYLFQPSAIPNDPLYRMQWHYPLIQLPQAWDVTTGTPESGSVVVAVVDTGVALGHPDLAGQLVDGFDFVSSTAISGDGDGIDADASDPGDGTGTTPSSFHGTHVAGTVAARSDDGAGVAGVAWGAKLMPVRVLGVGGGTSYDIIQGVRFAAGLDNDSDIVLQKKADVINLSLGCLDCFSATEQAEYAAVRNSVNAPIVVAAAGNENSTLPGYPASYANVVSVSAVDSLKARAPYSNTGPNVDVAAPGGNTSVDRDGDGYGDGVLSALVEQDATTPIWTFYQGTSMAAPHVAGVAALMRAVCPSLSAAQLDALLSSGAITDDEGAAGRDDVYGYGLVNAVKAVQAAQTECGGTATTALELTPTALDFGNATTALTLTATKVGPDALSVTAPTDDAEWLTVTATAVDADGLGTYTAEVSRASLADGLYRATITFAVGETSVAASVVMRVGAPAPTTGDAGYLYLLALDEAFTTIGQVSGRGASGSYGFELADLPDGKYYLVAGTDSDDDGVICDAGEACGAWPTLEQPALLEVASSGVSGLSFTVGFESPLGVLSAGPGPAWPSGGLRRLDREQKAFGGAR